MSIRIYALAKQLQVESKILFDACKDLGLEGKGSALASLTDEEVEQVKALVAKNAAKSAKAIYGTEGPVIMQKPSLTLHSGRIPVLKPSRPAILPTKPAVPQPPVTPPASEVAEPVEPRQEETPAPSVAPPAAVPEVVTAPKAPVEPETAKPDVPETPVPTPVTREPEPTTPPVSATAPKMQPAPVKPAQPVSAPTRSTPPLQDKSQRKPMRDKSAAPGRSSDRDANRHKPPLLRPRQEEPRRPSSLASLEEAARQAALEEMRRPPVITRNPNEHLVNLDTPSRKKDDKKEDKDDSHGSKAAGSKPSIAIHLAPLPTASAKQQAKKQPEEKAQKPEARFSSPEELRDAMQKMQRGVSPLSEHMKRGQDQRDRQRTGGATDGRTRTDRPGDRPRPRIGERTSERPTDRSTDRGDRSGARTERPRPTGRKMEIPVNPYFGEEVPSNKRGVKKGKGKAGEPEGREDLRESRRSKLSGDRGLRDRDEFDLGTEQRLTPRVTRQKRGKSVASTAPRKGDIVIEMPCTVKQFAEATGLSAAVVIKKLMEFGFLFTINHPIDLETTELLIEAFELKATVRKERTLEEEFVTAALETPDPEESLKARPPVVTFLGHVDHGKTSLLDKILKLDVVSGEKGGITQHIRAYRVDTPQGAVTFVDTPGHEAFTEMRARGAHCTDIAVLVVAADDGVMPQTEEAISHAKAAEVPIVVALNKMDLPGANRDRVIQELAANDLMPVEWGGDVEIVETSAYTGSGVENLVQTLLTIAELKELKANPDRAATGVALEAALLPGEGVVCKMLVQNGTLKTGDVVLCGNAYGRVKAMTDTLDTHRHMEEAGPSTPVALLGLDVAPGAGSKFVVLDDISTARQIAEERTKRVHETELAGNDSHVTLETLFDRISGGKNQQILNIIIRADVRGSIEAIRKELGKLEHPEVKVKILQASVGGITEADVHLADASDAIIVGFSVVPDEGARSLAEKKKVQIRRYDIIYKLTEDIKAALEGMLKPLEQVKELGRAQVQRTFVISRVGTIAGCRVISGTVERDSKVRIIRDSRVIGEYVLETLKREKDDAREVREGYECGIKLKNFNDIKEGDIFESYKIEEVARTF
ncbi:MAG: translation initiation factor IF-2 [Planctomycetia bacterium]|nr:translation initiation factor IF-2 [Planctomycetia bacterium]